MGGTQSRTVSNIITEAAISASMQTIQTCVAGASQTQIISVENATGDININNVNMKQGTEVNMKCLMTADKKNQIDQAVANAVVQAAESTGQAALSALGNTHAEAVSNVRNMLSTEVNMDSIQNSIASLSQTQGIKLGTVNGNVVISGVNMDQSAQLISTTMMQSTAYNTVLQKIANNIDQTATAKEEGLNLFGWLKYIIIGFVGFILLIIGGVVINNVVKTQRLRKQREAALKQQTASSK